MNMSSINVNGDFITIIRMNPGKNYFLDNELSFSAIDGTYTETFTVDGKISHVIIGVITGKILTNGDFIVQDIIVNDESCECEGESKMRELEYLNATKYPANIILLDRKLSYDRSLGIEIPKNAIGIVKDFDIPTRVSLNSIRETPWLAIKEKLNDLIKGYFKLFDVSWVFYLESSIFLDDLEKLLSILYIFGKEPVPEALGYNYPLFLADKLVKYYRNKISNSFKLLELEDNIRYREFRSLMEKLRNDGKYI
ncbi:nuclease [Sulfolobus sp. A20]|nr:nuclease [Sulfolobus sp. A20]TRM78534.1 nuclease [Sulfolobus sp. A20-N-F8]TRM79262.1 nuclease [Sulfolobus sp. B5]TRM89833.1 nuclease [Sulfolobus sp. C3]TRM95351.1 nuclease [Sulfolobus sp. A20-N-G8]TRN02052.1 nuclease [Sulfolobus sp. F1]TRN03027.1 nuclease [Sulfolobus sp. E1]